MFIMYILRIVLIKCIYGYFQHKHLKEFNFRFKNLKLTSDINLIYILFRLKTTELLKIRKCFFHDSFITVMPTEYLYVNNLSIRPYNA